MQKGRPVADLQICCGLGFGVGAALRTGFSAIGIDRSDVHLKYAVERIRRFADQDDEICSKIRILEGL